MEFKFYWKNPMKTLCSADISEASDMDEAREYLMDCLENSNEVYLWPLLCVINGKGN